MRYFEQGETAAYFGSPFAREAATGYYDAGRESRMVASTGKIIAAIAIANTLRDTPQIALPRHEGAGARAGDVRPKAPSGMGAGPSSLSPARSTIR